MQHDGTELNVQPLPAVSVGATARVTESSTALRAIQSNSSSVLKAAFLVLCFQRALRLWKSLRLTRPKSVSVRVRACVCACVCACVRAYDDLAVHSRSRLSLKLLLVCVTCVRFELEKSTEVTLCG